MKAAKEAAKEAAERICGGTEMHVGRTTKVIERACLEAQLEVARGLLNNYDEATWVRASRIKNKVEEIEAKLKAMK